MREGPIFKSVIIYTIPIILTGLLQLLFNAADLIVVGWFSGSDSVAAVGATSALTNLIVNLFIGLSLGAGVAVAQGIGAKNDKLTSRSGAYRNSGCRNQRNFSDVDRRSFFKKFS